MSTYFPDKVSKNSKQNQGENAAEETAELLNDAMKDDPSELEKDKFHVLKYQVY